MSTIQCLDHRRIRFCCIGDKLCRKPREESSETAGHFELGSDITKLLSSTGGKHLDETTESIPLPGASESVDLPELAGHQSTDPTHCDSNSTM